MVELSVFLVKYFDIINIIIIIIILFLITLKSYAKST